MEYYWPHELLLIGCGKRIDSVQPETNSIIIHLGRGIRSVAPLFLVWEDRTARPTGREQIADYLM